MKGFLAKQGGTPKTNKLPGLVQNRFLSFHVHHLALKMNKNLSSEPLRNGFFEVLVEKHGDGKGSTRSLPYKSARSANRRWLENFCNEDKLHIYQPPQSAKVPCRDCATLKSRKILNKPGVRSLEFGQAEAAVDGTEAVMEVLGTQLLTTHPAVEEAVEEALKTEVTVALSKRGKCESCQTKFGSLTSLRNHVRRFHERVLTGQELEQFQKVACKYCGVKTQKPEIHVYSCSSKTSMCIGCGQVADKGLHAGPQEAGTVHGGGGSPDCPPCSGQQGRGHHRPRAWRLHHLPCPHGCRPYGVLWRAVYRLDVAHHVPCPLDVLLRGDHRPS